MAVPRTINAARDLQGLSSGTFALELPKIAAILSNFLNAMFDLLAFTAVPATVNTAVCFAYSMSVYELFR